MTIRIGIAGWAIRREQADLFKPGPSHLARYATRFNAVEINSSFYRPHRRTTYERWAASVPNGFRFSVKIPKLITHELKLRDIDAPLKRFFGEVSGLGQKLGAILIQLPPSLAFDQEIAADFLSSTRTLFDVLLAIEPRHSSWFTAQAAETLSQSKIERVTADPPPCPGAPFWDDAPETRYFRLHGAPRIYYSDYPEDVLAAVTRILTISETDHPNWCIFDNTAVGRATANALNLRRLVVISESCSSRRSTPADRQ